MAAGKNVENSTRKLQSAVNKVATWTKKLWIKFNESKSIHTDFTNKKIDNQSSSMVHKIHTPIQWNILVWLLMPSYGGKSILWKKVMSSTSRSWKCIGCLDAILSCQSTINSYHTSKLHVQFGVMVSSFGAAPVVLILKWFSATKTKC
jgi:hypothetical protein